MAIIRDFTISTDTGTDRCIALQDEQIARTMDIGSSWTNVRVGILYCISASNGGSNPDTIINPIFGFGLSAGKNSLVGDSSTNHFVGFYSTASMLTIPNQLWWQRDEVKIAVKTGSGVIQYSSSNDGMWFGRDSNAQFQAVTIILYIDYVKSAGDPGLWTMKLWYPETTNGSSNFPSIASIANFYTHIQPLTSSVTAISSYTASIIQVPVSESAHGSLDTVNIYWTPTNQPLQISEVAVYRFS